MEPNQKDVIETIPNSELCNLTTLKDTLNSLLVSMKIFGSMYCDKLPGSHSTRNSVGSSCAYKSSPKDCSRNWRHILGVCYCIFVALLAMLPIAHGIFELTVDLSLVYLLSRAFFVSWVLLSLCQHLSCAYLTSFRWKNKKNRFDKFMDAMLFVPAASVKKMKCCVLRIVRVGWVLLITNFSIMAIGAFYPIEKTRKEVLKVFIGRSNWTVANNYELSCGYVVICMVLVGSWTIPSCFYISLCRMLSGCFDDLYQRASKDLKMRKINLGELRDEFVRLCNALSALNDLLSPLGMLMFSIYVPAICLNIN